MDNPFDEFGNPNEIARVIWDTDAFSAALGKAESGDVEAQFHLGMMYMEGNHFVDKDYAKAIEWLGKAAAQGHGEAQKEIDKLKSEGDEKHDE